MASKRALRKKAGTEGQVSPVTPVPAPPPPEPQFLAWVRRHSLAMLLVLLAIGSIRIISTYNVFSHTFDEPAHIACGMEWLVKGTWQYEPQHPPLARIAAAIGPYLASGRPHSLPTMAELGLVTLPVSRIWDSGLAILYRNGQYDRTLALARLGILPFFWIAAVVVFLWARRYLGDIAAILAVFFFTFIPPILAHSGLATTDMALSAFAGASFLAALHWVERPAPLRSVFFGAMTGLAVLSKFSSLPFIPMALAAALAWCFIDDREGLLEALQGWRRYLVPSLITALTCCLLVWAGYRFSFGAVPFLGSLKLPAPELFEGIRDVAEHNRQGDPTFLLGQHSQFGWWYYYLVVLAVKTPIPLLAFSIYGAVAFVRGKAWGPAHTGVSLAVAFTAGILLFCLASNINLGVRHILPVYIGFAIAAGAGAERVLVSAREHKWAGWLCAALVVWMGASSILSHPDYLPYFNALAGDEPENVLSDSDLDWGQDLKRLGRRMKEVGAPSLSFTAFQPADLLAMGFPPGHPLNPMRPSPGWNAVSVTLLKRARLGVGPELGDAKLWPERIEPTERVGKGIWLWYFPPDSARSP
jgi:hypothetical protein